MLRTNWSPSLPATTRTNAQTRRGIRACWLLLRKSKTANRRRIRARVSLSQRPSSNLERRRQGGTAMRPGRVGCTPHEIAAITGHASLKEIVRYTKTADRKRLAASAMEKVKAGTSIVKPVNGFDRKRKKS